MLEPKHIQTGDRPMTIQNLGDGTYYYNYDIKEKLIEEETLYSFIQVLLRGFPNYKDCVKAIIRSYITIDEEFDLINSYNSHLEGIAEDSNIIDKYKEYLYILDEIKTKVKLDFAKL